MFGVICTVIQLLLYIPAFFIEEFLMPHSNEPSIIFSILVNIASWPLFLFKLGHNYPLSFIISTFTYIILGTIALLIFDHLKNKKKN